VICVVRRVSGILTALRCANRFILALIAGGLVILLGVWCSSGTLAPYAATLEKPRIDKPCNYLLNSDHVHFEATFLMLDGAPREQWEFSIYLRRILFPLFAFPFMKAFGFLTGGVVASALVQLAAYAMFVLHVRKRAGDAAGYAAIALVALYPGTYYWAGLPYNHAVIAPLSMVGVLLLREIERAGAIRRIAMTSLLLGVTFLGYDLMPLFAPPAVMILLLRKKFVATPLAAALLVLPTLLTNQFLTWKFGVPFRNGNTQPYFDMLNAYLHPSNTRVGEMLTRVPLDLAQTFVFSNFWFLPAMFLVCFVENTLSKRIRMLSTERWLLLTTLGLFLFINFTPPYRGWQFRGSGVARIYQPAFAAMILFTARWFAAAWSSRRWTVAALATASLANALVIFGPVLHVRLADHVYFSFYRHATRPVLSENLVRFGRRPLGFCDTSISIENPLSNRELKVLKEKKKQREASKPAKKKKPAATTKPAKKKKRPSARPTSAAAP
jgi:hypothetical protein